MRNWVTRSTGLSPGVAPQRRQPGQAIVTLLDAAAASCTSSYGTVAAQECTYRTQEHVHGTADVIEHNFVDRKLFLVKE